MSPAFFMNNPSDRGDAFYAKLICDPPIRNIALAIPFFNIHALSFSELCASVLASFRDKVGAIFYRIKDIFSSRDVTQIRWRIVELISILVVNLKFMRPFSYECLSHKIVYIEFSSTLKVIQITKRISRFINFRLKKSIFSSSTGGLNPSYSSKIRDIIYPFVTNDRSPLLFHIVRPFLMIVFTNCNISYISNSTMSMRRIIG